MPMDTTSVRGLPVTPVRLPLRTASENASTRSSTAFTSGTTSLPSTVKVVPLGARSAACATARSSVTLRCLPLNMAAILLSRPAARARSWSLPMVSTVTRWRL